MNQVTRQDPVGWDPLHELEDMHRHLVRLLDRPLTRANGKEGLTTADWAPVVDIIEDDQGYVIKAELPEVRREDVHVRIENGVLILSGERKYEKEEKHHRYHRTERSFGTFERSFAMPADIDAGKVNATYRDGILTITVAKSEKARPKQIEVKVS